VTEAQADLPVHPNGLPYGTIRRTRGGFAHAVLCQQRDDAPSWECVDLYGAMEMLSDEEIANWPVVYVPAPDSVWSVVAPEE